MASLIRRTDTRNFSVQYAVNGQTVRRSLRTDCKKLAQEKLRQLESALARGEDNPLPSSTPIGEVLDRYVRDVRASQSAKQAQTLIYRLRATFGIVGEELRDTSLRGNRPRSSTVHESLTPQELTRGKLTASSFERITTAAIREYLVDRVQEDGISATTANHHRQMILTLFNWAIDQQGLRVPNGNPAAKVKRFKQKRSSISFLTLPQIEEQLQALSPHPQLQTMVAMLIYAGLRRSELLMLTIDDVDHQAGRYGMIRVRAKTWDGGQWQPKTGRDRAVPISSDLRKWLDRYQPSGGDPPWYFASPMGTLWDPDNFSNDLHVANTAAKLPWSCLDYRHTFGSQLAMKGESLYKISTLMGNSPEICRLHYAAILPEATIDSVEFPKPVSPPLKLTA